MAALVSLPQRARTASDAGHIIIMSRLLKLSPILKLIFVAFALSLNFLDVTIMQPCYLRTFCLHFISLNMHYYGDVEDGNAMQQTLVINAWWLMPL